MATQVLNGILGYLAIFMVARYMDAPDYALGVVSFAYGLVAIFNVFGNLGFEHAHIKRISEGKDLAACMGTFVAVKMVLTGFMGILLVVCLLVWKYLLGRGFESPEHETAVYVMLLYFSLWSLTQIMRSTFRARRETAKEQIPMFFETLARVTATIYIITVGWGAVALAWTYVAGELAVFFTALLFFKGYSIGRPSWGYFKSYVQFALPLAFVVASTKIMTNIDKVLIQLFWNATEGGNYFAIFRLCRFLDMATLAIGTLLFPTISALHARNDSVGIKKLSLLSERYLSMIMVPIVFLMIFLSRPIIHVMLSNKFYPAVPILQILPLFVLFDAMERPYQVKLIGMNLPHFARNRILLMVAINVGLNLILVPKDIRFLGIDLLGLGGEGAAIATVVAYFVGLVYTRIVVWKVSGITVNFRIGYHFLAALIMGFVVSLLTEYYLIVRWYELAVFGLMGLGIYLSILLLVKEFTRSDFDLFMDTLNVKKMFIYIKEELSSK